MAEVLDHNPQINRVLLTVRRQLREAVSSGETGEWGGRVKYYTKRLGKWTSGREAEDDLTAIGKAG
jgi:hypothetical protein